MKETLRLPYDPLEVYFTEPNNYKVFIKILIYYITAGFMDSMLHLKAVQLMEASHNENITVDQSILHDKYEIEVIQELSDVYLEELKRFYETEKLWIMPIVCRRICLLACEKLENKSKEVEK